MKKISSSGRLAGGPELTTSEQFYDWFVGFFEGDGSFVLSQRKSPKQPELSFTIKQKDRQVLEYIQSYLGFGEISTLPGNCFLFRVGKSSQLEQLIQIFAFRIRFSERYKSFVKWVAVFDQLKKTTWSTKIQQAPNIDLTTNWLSGFIQAEGYFRSQLRVKRPKSGKGKGYSILIRVILTQNKGRELFSQLKEVFPKSCLTRDRETDRLTISSASEIEMIRSYLEFFPLVGRKRIAQSRWTRLIDFRARGLILPPKNTLEYAKFRRLVVSVNLCQSRSPLRNQYIQTALES